MEDRKELLISYIKANVAPVLVDFITGVDITKAVVIPSKIDRKELTGHFEGSEYVAPGWYKELEETEGNRVLIIDNIDMIPKEEQLKFSEILEYRKISTFELPKDCVIIVTASEINKEKINEEIFSLVAII